MNSIFEKNSTPVLLRKMDFPFSSWVGNVVFWGIAAIACVSVMYDANLIFGDEHTFLTNICQGIYRPFTMASRSVGRFTPFTHWDCNLVLLLKFLPKEHYVTAMYVLNALCLLISLFLFSRLVKTAVAGSGRWSAVSIYGLALATMVLTPDFMRVFWHNVFPESRLMFLFLGFAIAFRRAVENDSWKSAIVAFLLIAIAIGYKETWLVICLGFVGTYLLWGCGAVHRHERIYIVLGWGVLRRCGRVLAITLVAMVIGYVLFYKFWWVSGIHKSYTDGRTLTLANCLSFYLTNPVLVVAVALACFRLFVMLFKRDRRHLFWDAMLFSGIGFALSYAAIGLRSKYYIAPAYVFLIPALAYWLGRISDRRCLFILTMVSSATYLLWSSPKIIRQWEVIHDNRLSNVPFVKDLASNKSIRKVYYFLPKNGLYEDASQTVFKKYYTYAGGTNLYVIKKFSELAEDEAIVISLYDKNGRNLSAMLKRKSVASRKSERFEVFYGPTVVHIGDERGVEINHSDDLVMTGFYGDEKSGRWGEANNATLKFKVAPQLARQPLLFWIKARSGTALGRNGLHVCVNGVEVAYKNGVAPGDIKFELPANTLTSGMITVKFLVDRVICPNELGIGKDTRKQGVWFQSLKITAIDKAKESK